MMRVCQEQQQQQQQQQQKMMNSILCISGPIGNARKRS